MDFLVKLILTAEAIALPVSLYGWPRSPLHGHYQITGFRLGAGVRMPYRRLIRRETDPFWSTLRRLGGQIAPTQPSSQKGKLV